MLILQVIRFILTAYMVVYLDTDVLFYVQVLLNLGDAFAQALVEFQNCFVHVLLWVIVRTLIPFNLLKIKILLHILCIGHLTWLFLNFV